MNIHNQNIREYINKINIKFSNDNNDETFNEIFMDIDLDDYNKKIFIRRVSEILINNGKKCKIYNTVLTILRYILQIFSAILTFTLSINSLTNVPYLNYINLAILFILTLTTNIYFQSKLGEKYITIKKSYNKVLKELWAYISLSGSYSGKSHQENLTSFYNTIDKIIEQENNMVINIDREIDRTMNSGNGSNNISKMKLGSKNDKHEKDVKDMRVEGVEGVNGRVEGVEGVEGVNGRVEGVEGATSDNVEGDVDIEAEIEAIDKNHTIITIHNNKKSKEVIHGMIL
jgi:hypothetical protein